MKFIDDICEIVLANESDDISDLNSMSFNRSKEELTGSNKKVRSKTNAPDLLKL
jgi:hypothetical protein